MEHEFENKRNKKSFTEEVARVEALEKEIVSLDKYRDVDITPQEKYLIDKFLLRNKINLIVGDMWSGKTNFALLMINSLVSPEKKFFNWDVFLNEDENILYIDGENEIRTLAERWKVLIGSDFSPRIKMLYAGDKDFDLFNTDFLNIFANSQKRINKIGVVVIDPLIVFAPRIKENDPYQVRFLINNLRKTFCSKGITPILIHHLAKPKDDDNDKVNWWRIRGSSDFPAGADMIWACFKETREELSFFVKCLKNRVDIPFKKTIYFEWNNDFGFTLNENYTTEDTKSEKLKNLILEMMKNNDGVIDGREIDRLVVQLKVSSPLKWKVLKQLKDEGKIISQKKAGGTIYLLTDIESLINNQNQNNGSVD